MSFQLPTRFEERDASEVSAICRVIGLQFPTGTSNNGESYGYQQATNLMLQCTDSATPQTAVLTEHFQSRTEDLAQRLSGYTASSITDDVLRDAYLDLLKSGVRAVLNSLGDGEIVVLTSREEFAAIEQGDDARPCAFARSSIPAP